MCVLRQSKWIEMTGYNKLKIAILAIMTSQAVNAITIDPIQIESGSGDLLYAEMKFSNSNPNEKIEVGLADADDIQTVGVATQTPGHLNFYTRRSNDGSGVIVITSSRPLIESELNILLKIKEGNATHLQQIKKPLTRERNTTPAPILKTAGNEKALTPQIIVSEKDIALNLPTSMQYQRNINQTQTTTEAKVASTNSDSQRPLAISVIAAPTLNNQTAVAKTTTSNAPSAFKNSSQPITGQTANNVPLNTPQQIVAQAQDNSSQPAEPKTVKTTQDKKATPSNQIKSEQSKAEVHKTKEQKQQANNSNQVVDKNSKHVVQANESLWKIASRIASETNQTIPQVMKQIKENNTDAFIQGDVNRIRRGVALNLAASYHKLPTTKYKVPPQPSSSVQKQSGSAKYRLDQAEMSIVADNEQSSAQGSAKKNTQLNPTSAELSTKVMTSREKTVKLQKNVTQLASALQQKNQRIQLLNARLAQLQQQLQQQNVKKPNS